MVFENDSPSRVVILAEGIEGAGYESLKALQSRLWEDHSNTLVEGSRYQDMQKTTNSTTSCTNDLESTFFPSFA